MNKPLYIYQLDTITGEIIQIKIDQYEYCNTGYNRYHPIYRSLEGIGKRRYRYSVRECNLDKYTSGKLFSFNDDKVWAKSLIVKYLRIDTPTS